MFRVQKALLNMWEYSPTLVNFASDWLRAEGSLVDEEEIKINKDDGVTWYFTRFGGIFFLLVHLWVVQPRIWDPE